MVNQSMLSKHEIEELERLGKLAFENDNYELEIKINRPKITKDAFMRVRDFCRSKTCASSNNWVTIKEQSISLDISLENDFRISIYGKSHIEKFFKTDSLNDIPDGSWNVIQKRRATKSGKDICNDIGCKVNFKEEIEVNPRSDAFALVLSNWDDSLKTFRLKNRYSYSINNTYCVDLTAVRSRNVETYKFSKSRTFEADEKYEIEIEYTPSLIGDINENTERNPFDANSLIEILDEILREQRQVLIIVPFKDLGEVENSYFYTLSKTHNFGLNDKKNFKIEPKVVSLSMSRLRRLIEKASDYYVTPKSDGLRMTGYIHSSGELFLIGSKSTHFEPTGYMFENSMGGTIFDGEFVRQDKSGIEIAHYLVFDCYYDKNEDIRQKSLIFRRNVAKEIIDSSLSSTGVGGFKIILKNFIPTTKETFFEMCNKCFEDIENDIYENDGLIFTPIDKVGGNHLYTQQAMKRKRFVQSGYEFPRLLKWKDATFNSIDFKIKFSNSEEELPLNVGNGKYIMTKFKLCELSVNYDYEPKPFSYIQYMEYMNLSEKEKQAYNEKRTSGGVRTFVPYYPEDKYASFVKLPMVDGKLRTKMGDTWNGSVISNGSIVEMIYDKNADIYNRWIPIRIRQDKDIPNAYRVAIDIWKSYYMPVTLDIMKGNEEIPSIDQEMDTYYNNDVRKNNKRNSYRQFHRLVVKHSILLESVGQTKGKKLLDLGSGKGGDISRYVALGLNVVGVDNSVDNIHNPGDGAYRRLCNEYDNKPNIEKDNILFIAGDVTKPFSESDTFHDIYPDIVSNKGLFDTKYSFDAATVFFALHYFFKSKDILRTFLKNVDDNVKIGGYFAGCCYDGQIVYNELEKTGILSYKDSDEEEIIQIKKQYKDDSKFIDDPHSSFGYEIKVLVQSIDKEHSEYLVNFDLLVIELFNIGFELVSSENFKHYTTIPQPWNKKPITLVNKEDEKISFLNRSFIFKRVRIPELVRVKNLKHGESKL